MWVVGDIQVVLCAWSQDETQGLRNAREYFCCSGILPATSFKFVPYHNQLVILFSLLAYFLDLGKLVTDSAPMQGNKSRNLPLPP